MLARAIIIGSALCLVLAACTGGGDQLIIGVATSVRDSGLIDELVEEFKERNPDLDAAVKPVAAGSGQLFKMARRGDVDLIVTHSPDSEAELLADGDGIDRRPVMHNLFLVVGPSDDPAGIGGATSIAKAFSRIAEAEATYVSRGDLSGTNVRELAVWEEIGIDPAGMSWYQESGAAQGQSLLVASDKGAYTLVDSSTFIVFQERLALEPYVFDDEPNRYSIIRVNPEKHDVNEAAALAFADFLTSPVAQRIIAEFGRERYKEPLFVAASIAFEGEPAATPER